MPTILPSFGIPASALSKDGTISFIGMAGTGKTTVGKGLAVALGWACIDTDRLLEAYFGIHLQDLVDTLGLSDFLIAEEQLVTNLDTNRCIISTGGSLIYSFKAIARLKSLGPVIYLKASLATIRRRMAESHYCSGLSNCPIDTAAPPKPDATEELHFYKRRGLVIAPDQTLEDLYYERLPLYAKAADFILATDTLTATDCIETVRRWLAHVH
ncbi:Shikimate kinase [Desulfovibrionales bacterium]